MAPTPPPQRGGANEGNSETFAERRDDPSLRRRRPHSEKTRGGKRKHKDARLYLKVWRLRTIAMRTPTLLLLILGGYGVAFGLAMLALEVRLWLAMLALEVRLWLTDTPDAQASAGMYAFVDGMLFLAVLGLL